MKKLFALLFFLPLSLFANPRDKATWLQVMGPTQAKIPAPGNQPIAWGKDVDAALAEAKRSKPSTRLRKKALMSRSLLNLTDELLDFSRNFTIRLKSSTPTTLIRRDS